LFGEEFNVYYWYRRASWLVMKLRWTIHLNTGIDWIRYVDVRRLVVDIKRDDEWHNHDASTKKRTNQHPQL